MRSPLLVRQSSYHSLVELPTYTVAVPTLYTTASIADTHRMSHFHNVSAVSKYKCQVSLWVEFTLIKNYSGWIRNLFGTKINK